LQIVEAAKRLIEAATFGLARTMNAVLGAHVTT
jgi:hypothetical protein